MQKIIKPLHHDFTSQCVRAERAFLAALEGGCQIPIGALASLNETNSLILHGFVSDVRGRDVVRGSISVDPSSPERAGQELAADLRTRGATSLLMDLRSSSQLISPQPE